jgi:hypothetical protein
MMRARKACRGGVIGLGMLVLAGCGGGGSAPPASCLQVQPCGGDLVGTWDFVGACVAEPSVITAAAPRPCTGFALNGVGFATAGSISFNADLTYTARRWNTSSATNYAEPLTCAGSEDCAALNRDVRVSNGSYLKTMCAGTSVCTCADTSLEVIDESGTYMTAGAELQLAGPLTTRNRTYCVSGAELHVVEVAGAVVIDDMVAVRI